MGPGIYFARMFDYAAIFSKRRNGGRRYVFLCEIWHSCDRPKEIRNLESTTEESLYDGEHDCIRTWHEFEQKKRAGECRKSCRNEKPCEGDKCTLDHIAYMVFH